MVAIARGTAKKALATELGAHHYIDSQSTDVAQELVKLGGAQVIVATAAAGDSTSALLAGLVSVGRLVVVGAAEQPIQVAPTQLVFGDVNVSGSLTGKPIENEDNLRFTVAQDVRSMNEVVSLDNAADAFERMSSGAARFRMVLAV